MDVRVGLWRRLSAEELMLLYSGLENSKDYTYSPWGRKELDMPEQLSLLEAEPIGLLIDAGVQEWGKARKRPDL